MNAPLNIGQIGQRLKAFRLGSGLSPDDLAKSIGVSRAAIYRYESGQPTRIDILARIAEKLDVGLPTLLGVGVEYIASAVSFFERMRQLEETVDQIHVLFGPVSYLLTTEKFDELLPRVLDESIPSDAADRSRAMRDLDILMGVLHDRKAAFRRHKPAIVSLVSAAELDEFQRFGFVGSFDPPGVDLAERRDVAREEIRNIVRMLRDQPIGTQVGIVIDSMPGASFQVFRSGSATQVAVSPFRLGAFANMRLGVATITAAPEAIKLYGTMVERLWKRSLKGEEAASFIETQILDKNKS